MPRVIISGVPNAGKTTLAAKLFFPEVRVAHSDDLQEDGPGFDVQESKIIEKIFLGDYHAAEGCMMVRATRAWMREFPDRKPCDVFIWLGHSFIEPTPQLEKFGKGLTTVFEQIEDELREMQVYTIRADFQ